MGHPMGLCTPIGRRFLSEMAAADPYIFASFLFNKSASAAVCCYSYETFAAMSTFARKHDSPNRAH